MTRTKASDAELRRNYMHRLYRSFTIGDGCWEWTARKSPGGYGRVMDDSHYEKQAHRAVYEWLVGPIPPTLVLDHTCSNRGCVRPDHLQPVTASENLSRQPKAQQTHCIHGHEFTPENTYIKRNGTRECRPCYRKRALDRYYRRKEG